MTAMSTATIERQKLPGQRAHCKSALIGSKQRHRNVKRNANNQKTVIIAEVIPGNKKTAMEATAATISARSHYAESQ